MLMIRYFSCHYDITASIVPTEPAAEGSRFYGVSKMAARPERADDFSASHATLFRRDDFPAPARRRRHLFYLRRVAIGTALTLISAIEPSKAGCYYGQAERPCRF